MTNVLGIRGIADERVVVVFLMNLRLQVKALQAFNVLSSVNSRLISLEKRNTTKCINEAHKGLPKVKKKKTRNQGFTQSIFLTCFSSQFFTVNRIEG